MMSGILLLLLMVVVWMLLPLLIVVVVCGTCKNTYVVGRGKVDVGRGFPSHVQI
jgi:hypothetical protein